MRTHKAEKKRTWTPRCVGGDEGRGLRIVASNDEMGHCHDVGSECDGDKAIDVLGDGYQNLSRHVPALLRARSLVFNMNSSGTLLGEPHDGRETSMSWIGVGDDGSEIVDSFRICGLRRGEVRTVFPLLRF